MSTGAPSPAEHVVARLRPHARRLTLPALVFIAASGAIGYFAGRFDEAWQNLLVLVGGAVLIVVVFLVPLLSWLSTRYTITTRRIIVRHGLFVRERRELLHSRGYEVTLRRRGLQGLFRSGDIVVNVSVERPVTLRDVPRANLIQAALHDLIENAQRAVAQPARDSTLHDTVAWQRR